MRLAIQSRYIKWCEYIRMTICVRVLGSNRVEAWIQDYID
jgi:hypothetical protein